MQKAGSAKIWKENTDFSLLLKTKKIVHILIHFQYSTSQHSSVWPKLFGGAYVFRFNSRDYILFNYNGFALQTNLRKHCDLFWNSPQAWQA